MVRVVLEYDKGLLYPGNEFPENHFGKSISLERISRLAQKCGVKYQGPICKSGANGKECFYLKHRAFVFAQSPCFSSWVSKHKSRVLKNPNTPRASARGFLTGLDFFADEMRIAKRFVEAIVEEGLISGERKEGDEHWLADRILMN